MTDKLGFDHQRHPPSNVPAEQALLGALLANNKAYERVSEFLAAEHFADPIHGRIYQAIARRVDAGKLASVATLKAELEHAGILKEVGGIGYLTSLMISVKGGIINVSDHGRAILDTWIRRELIDIGEIMVNNAYSADPEHDGARQIAAAEQSLFDISPDNATGGFVTVERTLTDAITDAEQAFRRSGNVSGLTTGLRDLDAKIGGLHPADLTIIASRPGMGKTALITKIALSAARALQTEAEGEANASDVTRKGMVAIFSLEMSAEQIGYRLFNQEAKISSDRVRRGDLSKKDFDNFVQVTREIAGLPIAIDDTPAITLPTLRSRCRHLKRTDGLSLVIVDYIQLMRFNTKPKLEHHYLEISMITQGLKAMAKELAVPVVAVCQLRRRADRAGERPELTDLIGAGSIDEDADTVMFLHRDEYYLLQKEPKESDFEGNDEKFRDALHKWVMRLEAAHNRADLIISKQRFGPTGTISLLFEAEFTRFADLT